MKRGLIYTIILVLALTVIAGGIGFVIGKEYTLRNFSRITRARILKKQPFFRRAFPERRVERRKILKRLSQALGLSSEQKEKMRVILDEERRRIQQVRQDFLREIFQVREDTEKRIREILEPSQQEKFRRIMKDKKSKMSLKWEKRS